MKRNLQALWEICRGRFAMGSATAGHVTKLKSAVLACALAASPWAAANTAPYEVLELPAVPSALATKSLIYSISKFGDRYFASGHHGHILYSDDGGDSWTQAQVPVRSSILDIDFPTPELGWAVGHEGVILHSADGGKTWVKQYDGRRYGQEGLAYYQARAAAEPANERYALLVEEMKFAVSQGADKPLFKVAFLNETHGYVLGAYGMVLETRDGGQSWQHILEKLDNDAFYHIFDLAPLAEPDKYFLSGEAGLLMVGDIQQDVATKVSAVPWEGSFFTLINAPDGSIIIGGLRGNMFRTVDAGATWSAVKKPISSAIVDSTRLADGRLVAVGIGGEVLVSADNGVSYKAAAIADRQQLYTTEGRIYAVAEGPAGTLLVGGPSGISKLTLPQ